jgi:hypothetical protein
MQALLSFAVYTVVFISGNVTAQEIDDNNEILFTLLDGGAVTHTGVQTFVD